MSQALRDARRYEEAMERAISPEDRPAFHLSARVGWLNDPNGFSFYGGRYHLFYQYNPYDSHWGPMHWGHAVSEDLLHWTYAPAALAPDMPYDRDGCYSGSAVTLPDGRHMLMYTGVQRVPSDNGQMRHLQTQNLAFGDGTDYQKYHKNPVIRGRDLPAGGSVYDFRDPRIIPAPDGGYWALIANDQSGEGGRILVYESSDAIHWKYGFVLAENKGRLGCMWECPDFFELDGRHVLLVSSQDMLPKGFEYHNGNGAFYLLGDFDAQARRFTEESDHTVDYGIDFYAPQTFLTSDGRRVMIGWMQNWDTCNLHTNSKPWFGQMSLPRELSLRAGVLYQRPIRELEALHSDEVIYERVELADGAITLPGVSGRLVDLEVEVVPMGESYNRFAVRFAKNSEFYTSVSFRPHESVVKIDRKFSGSRRAIIHQRRALVEHEGGRIKLRLILDRYSAEVFVNDGRKVLSATLYTDPSADGIEFFADGAVKINVKKYRIDA